MLHYKTIQKIIIMITIILLNSLCLFAYSDTNLYINNKLIFSEEDTIILENNISLAPLRVCSEQLGATVAFDKISKQITITRKDIIILLQIGNVKAKVNGNAVTLPLAPKIYHQKTYIPFRFIVEALNASVTYDDINKVIYITDLAKSSATISTPDTFHLYTNQNSDFSINYPIEFWQQLLVMELSSGNNTKHVLFRHLHSGADLFTVVLYNKKNTTKRDLQAHYETSNMQVIAENKTYYFAISIPTDLQYPLDQPDLAYKYHALYNQLPEILLTFKPLS